VSSILTDTKKALGITEDYEIFDLDLKMHINSVLSILVQLGIGPSQGFTISDKTALWTDFVTDDRLVSVQTYVYLRVRLLFDPPQTSYLQQVIKEQYQELEYRLSVQRELFAWIDPTPPVLGDDVYDGGEP